MNNLVLKYVLLFVLLAVVLSYAPNLNIDRETVIKVALIVILLLVLVDYSLRNVVSEGMDDVKQPCDEPVRIPRNFEPTSLEQDELMSGGLRYDLNNPQNVLLHGHQFEEQLMDFDKVRKIVDMQRYNYDVQGPGYYLLNNGNFAQDGQIPFSKSGEVICASKLNDMFNILNRPPTSPHTHEGKNRGYLNPEPTYQ